MQQLKDNLKRIGNAYTFLLLKSYASIQLISQINSLVSLFIISKYLGPANMGLISYAQNLAVLSIFIHNGIDTWSTYEMLRHNHVGDDDVINKKNEAYISDIFSKSQRAKFAVTIISLLFIIPIILWKSDNNYELTMYMLAIILASISSTFVTLFNSYAIATRLIPSLNRGAIIVSIMILISRLVGVYFGFGAIFFLLLILGESLMILSIFIYHNNKIFKKRNLFLSLIDHISYLRQCKISYIIKIEWNNMLQILYSTRYFISIYIFSLFASRMDLYMLKYYIDNRQLGIYTAAMRLAEYPGIVSGIIGNILVVNLALTVSPKIRHISILLGYVSNILLALFFILLFYFTGNNITHFIYGDAYDGVAMILTIYSVGILGIFINNFSSLIFMTHKKEKYLLYSNIIGAIALTFMCYLWIPVYGTVGAAISSSISYLLVAFFSVFIAIYIEHRHHKNKDTTVL